MENKTLTKIYNMLTHIYIYIYIYLFIYLFIDKNILDYWFGSVWFGLNANQTKPFGLSKT